MKKKAQSSLRRSWHGPVVAEGRGRSSGDTTFLSDTWLVPKEGPPGMTATDVSEVARLCALVLAGLLLLVASVPTASQSTAWRTPLPSDASFVLEMDYNELLDNPELEEYLWGEVGRFRLVDQVAVGTENHFFLGEVELSQDAARGERTVLRGLAFPESQGYQSLAKLLCTGEGEAESCSVLWPRDPELPSHLFTSINSIMMIAVSFPGSSVQCTRRANVLVLGLGMGTIPSMMNYYMPEWAVDVVELNGDMVANARRFGLSEPSKRRQAGGWRAFVEDANQFVAGDQCRGNKYDLIIVDMAMDDLTPPFVRSDDFLEGVQACLTGRGLVIVNMIGSTERQRVLQAHVETVQLYSSAFRHSYLMETSWFNRLLVLHNMGDQPATPMQLMANSIARPDFCHTPYFTWGRGYLFPLAAHPDWPDILARTLHAEEDYLPNY